MSGLLRVMLVLTSLLTFVFVVRKMRKAKMQVFDSLVWILFSVMLVFIGVFPQMIGYVKTIIGIESSVNCVYLIIIFFLIIQVFSLSVRLSLTEYKLKNAVEYFSVMHNIKNTNIQTDNRASSEENDLE